MRKIEKLWMECSALGNKLDGMTTHAAQIAAQNQEEGNDWQWANSRNQPLPKSAMPEIPSVAPVSVFWAPKKERRAHVCARKHGRRAGIAL